MGEGGGEINACLHVTQILYAACMQVRKACSSPILNSIFRIIAIACMLSHAAIITDYMLSNRTKYCTITPNSA